MPRLSNESALPRTPTSVHTEEPTRPLAPEGSGYVPARLMHISIFERRRVNLQRLLDTRFRGNQAELSRQIKRSPSYVWRLLSKETAHPKHLGEDLARLIEGACGLPELWLDQEHPDQARGVLDGLSSATSEAAPLAPRQSEPRSFPVYDPTTIAMPMTGRVSGVELMRVYTDAPLGPLTFVVVARGKAMEPDISEGDKVFIDPEVKPQAGDVVLAITGRETRSAVLRQYRPAGDSTDADFELFATNQAFASIRPGQADCQLIGVMVEHHRYRKPRL
jgi:SOS-response transcriptional repressor LexA